MNCKKERAPTVPVLFYNSSEYGTVHPYLIAGGNSPQHICVMKKLSIVLLIVYFLLIMMFAMQSTVEGFHSMIEQLRHNPADVYVTFFPKTNAF